MKSSKSRRFKRLMWALICLTVLSPTLSHAEFATVNIVDFGAVGDGRTINTEAIQKAIDACSQKGGGLVRVPNGQFVTGTILLKNNCTLHLEDRAELLGSLNPKDYRNIDPFK